MARFVYADNAATTPVSQAVIDAMAPCFATSWGTTESQIEELMEILDQNPEKPM